MFLLTSPLLLSVRIAILQKFTEFHKTKALNDGVRYIKVKMSIVFIMRVFKWCPYCNVACIAYSHISGSSFYL